MTENQQTDESKGPDQDGRAPETASEAGGAEARIAALEAERNELRDRMLRIAADFENWKKRARKDQADAEVKAREAVLKDVLEVADNLERAAAVDATADLKAIQQGISLVLRQFQSKLERYDVKPIEAKGQPFDPRVHDAISQVPTADAPAGSVLSELQKGYRIGDRLLRPAMVVVAVAPPSGGGAGPNGAAGGGDGAGGGT
jgi:molecular chaperone GrpE